MPFLWIQTLTLLSRAFVCWRKCYFEEIFILFISPTIFHCHITRSWSGIFHFIAIWLIRGIRWSQAFIIGSLLFMMVIIKKCLGLYSPLVLILWASREFGFSGKISMPTKTEICENHDFFKAFKFEQCCLGI